MRLSADAEPMQPTVVAADYRRERRQRAEAILLRNGVKCDGRSAKMTTQTFTAVVHREDDLYVAECPEVGTVSQGRTVEEAVANLKEATELYLEEFPLPDVGRPWLTTFEVAHA